MKERTSLAGFVKDEALDYHARVFCRRANWYDTKGKLLGAGRMRILDIRQALDAAQHANPSQPYVIVVNKADEPGADNMNRDVDKLLDMSAFVFGKTNNYFVAMPEIRKSLKDKFEEEGFEFTVLTPDQAKRLLT